MALPIALLIKHLPVSQLAAIVVGYVCTPWVASGCLVKNFIGGSIVYYGRDYTHSLKQVVFAAQFDGCLIILYGDGNFYYAFQSCVRDKELDVHNNLGIVKQMWAGAYSIAAQLTDGSVVFWCGRMGNRNRVPNVHSVIPGPVYFICFGEGDLVYNQTDVSNHMPGVKRVVTGYSACMILTETNIYSFLYNQKTPTDHGEYKNLESAKVYCASNTFAVLLNGELMLFCGKSGVYERRPCVSSQVYVTYLGFIVDNEHICAFELHTDHKYTYRGDIKTLCSTRYGYAILDYYATLHMYSFIDSPVRIVSNVHALYAIDTVCIAVTDDKIVLWGEINEEHPLGRGYTVHATGYRVYITDTNGDVVHAISAIYTPPPGTLTRS